ncbi:hypothetical protein FRC02_012093 [Tulasnella sp. 418]|nr:hypothetical protein FRC02_012093 [Tulasnella sp. 418]
MEALASTPRPSPVTYESPVVEEQRITNPAAVSRQAAQIIRKAVASGSPGMGFRVLNGIYRHSARLQEGNLPSDIPVQSTIPRRLATTAMVHALLRAGKPLKAAQVAEIAWIGREKGGSSIGGGMNLSYKTSDAIIAALCQPSSLQPAGLQPWEIFADVKNSSQLRTDLHSKVESRSEDPDEFAQHVKWMEGIVNKNTSINPRAQSLSFFSPRGKKSSSGPTPSSSSNTASTQSSSSPRSSRTRTKLDYSTQRAILFVRVARHARQKRTTHMYKRIIDACLIQGEVIVGTLLFVLLVRDWQARQMIKAAEMELGHHDGVDAGDSGSEGNNLAAQKPTLDQPISLQTFPTGLLSGINHQSAEHIGIHRVELPYPSPTLIPPILNALNLSISQEDQNPRRVSIIRTSKRSQVASSRADPVESGEALSHLFHLLRERSLPEVDAHLIRALGDLPEGFPQTINIISPLLADEVFDTHESPMPLTVQSGKGQQKKGIPLQAAAHKVLLSLLAEPYQDPPEGQPPVLSMRAHTELLSFSLRNSLTDSLGNARKVLRGIVQAGLEPNEHVGKIILRTATLQRLDSMGKASLDSIALGLEAKKELGEGIDLRVLLLIYALRARWNPHDVSLLSKLRDLQAEMNKQAEKGQFFWGHSALLHTLIQYLVSNGHADLVVQNLPLLIPSLGSRHLNALDVAASYGPSLYIAIFNAIAKLPRRNTGSAERLWHFMKAAERQSWWLFLKHVYQQRAGLEAETAEVHGWPWLMSVHGYTLMMKIYAREGKSGVLRAEGIFRPQQMYTKGWGSTPLDHEDNDNQLHEVDLKSVVRSETARHRALHIHHRLLSLPHRVPQVLQSMWNKLEDAYGILPEVDAPKGFDLWDLRTPSYPTPNAAYFNEALDLWGRVDGCRMRKSVDRVRTHRRSASSRKSISRSRAIHPIPGSKVKAESVEHPNLEGNLYFERLKNDMEKFGFELPPAFRPQDDIGRKDSVTDIGPQGPFKIPWKRPAGDERDCVVHPNSPPWRWESHPG